MNSELPDVFRALRYALSKLGYIYQTCEPKYGWHKKTAGIATRSKCGGEYWVKVRFRELDTPPDKLWLGEIDLPNIPGIKRPALERYFEWIENGIVWRASVFAYIKDSPCSPSPELIGDVSITRDWLDTLDMSLRNLASVKTVRCAIRQDLVNRRIHERFGRDVFVDVSSWVTGHGDLHWANITREECWILDWESWGTVPFGSDLAFLYCFSLMSPKVADIIFRRFELQLCSVDGKISLLFAIAELLRMIEVHGDHPGLRVPLLNEASKILANFR
ncbi:hypothetical protein [Noviherbaspirillum sp.]|uniref:hypothetical protein n=1 Tax=Noviherbaspirillum sp. TaxID=1926288 RepID=UPI002FE426E9